MATYPSILPWRILWTEEPGRLQSMGFLFSTAPFSCDSDWCSRVVLSDAFSVRSSP